ncbi:MAG: NUDIX domain-containing protein [Desulfurococcales archaeon]|nr:NUDIX domain-containing protein [Desulfurococcales archaeon]
MLGAGCLKESLIDPARMPRVETSVMALVWGEPVRVLLARKSCMLDSYWACDAVLPGGHVKGGESIVDAALREAWEEAWVHPSTVRVLGGLPVETTRIGGIRIAPIVAVVNGPVCARPVGGEIDRVFWEPVSIVYSSERGPTRHPRRNIIVDGVRLRSGAVLWGATLRILESLAERLKGCGLV